MASNKGLGKGLGALLGDFSEEPVSDSAYRLLPIYKVEPNPDQPRQVLTLSKAFGHLTIPLPLPGIMLVSPVCFRYFVFTLRCSLFP